MGELGRTLTRIQERPLGREHIKFVGHGNGQNCKASMLVRLFEMKINLRSLPRFKSGMRCTDVAGPITAVYFNETRAYRGSIISADADP
jgi:hypothetical protein